MKANLIKAAVAALPIIIAGCQSSPSHYYDDDFSDFGLPAASDERIIVERKRYATGIGSKSAERAKYKVEVSGIKGATLKYEPYSRIGNADYEVNGERYEVWKDIESYREIGIASWYGPGFHGQFTSNGELYDQKGISAAHKNLPLPSYVKVTNLDNGRALVVRVNDRGPFHEGRIIDLSEGAAQALGVIENGTAKVKVELIKVPAPANAKELIAKQNSRYAQIVATGDKERAEQIAAEVRVRTSLPAKLVFVKNYTGMFKVYAGPFLPEKAERALRHIQKSGYEDAYLLYLD